jgi:hypothetical protein
VANTKIAVFNPGNFPTAHRPIHGGRQHLRWAMHQTILKSLSMAALVSMLVVSTRYAAAAECKTVTADQTATLPSATTTTGVITHGGFLNGTTTDTFTSALTATPDPSMFSFTDTLIISAKGGTLTDTDVTIYNLSLNAFSTISQISSGTGEFAGATGTLFISGSSTDDINFTDKIVGQLCLPRAD